MSPASAVTIARAVKPRVIMAKVINVDEDGMITGVEPSPQGFLFEFREVEVSKVLPKRSRLPPAIPIPSSFGASRSTPSAGVRCMTTQMRDQPTLS